MRLQHFFTTIERRSVSFVCQEKERERVLLNIYIYIEGGRKIYTLTKKEEN